MQLCGEHTYTSEDFSPSISIGNVPQLTVDLLITNLRLQRIGFLEDENVIPVAGASETGVAVAVEVYQSSDNEWTVIQQRAPVIKKKWRIFAQNLLTFIKESRFSKVILLSSADATRRMDFQLTGIPLRFLMTSSLPDNFSEKAVDLGLKVMEKIPKDRFESLNEYLGKKQDEADLPSIPGGGISKHLFFECQKEKIPLLMIICFAIEGDNTQDAFLLADYTNALLGLIPHQDTLTKCWKMPSSWAGLFGTPYDQSLYQ
ncbi:13764_t:CDS:2 [Acaulospora morrowiae]|uniref:Proteasome assembly chaperone 2 n=1 Tax=Acaulospora morrowiae TaxID=94023 RepID=A0A9N9F6A5_9GLOM|nr:13764_t:CDS:2 [Acaulospora morrowiae]